MSRFDADLRLLSMDSQDWELFSEMNGAGLAAHNLTSATQAALDKMVEWVAAEYGVRTAAKRAYKHVDKTMKKYEDLGGLDGPKGVLINIIEEFARRRFEADIDLYWEIEEDD